MARTVLKFGGTSVADLDRISHVADIVAHRAARGEKIAVIVSAMSGETNKLVSLAKGAAGGDVIGDEFDDEYDVVVASGEQVTSGLLALSLRKRGLKARSWLGWQMRMKTREGHGAARIDGFDEDSGLGAAIDAGEVAVIAGFQGVTEEGRVSTLGRGGSDTTAVAVAAALGSVPCDIYTDVDGVYTTDPRIVPQARRLPRVSYEEMLEMASLGAKVLQTRSVELAMNHQVPLRVLSSFSGPEEDNPGTWICNEDEIVEKQIVNGVTYSRDEAKITLYGMEDKPGTSAKLFALMARKGVNVDMVFEHPGEATFPVSTFVVKKGGMVVICAGTSGFNLTFDVRYMWMHQKRLQGSHFAYLKQASAANQLMVERRLDPCMSEVFEWNDLPQAHMKMLRNEHKPGNMSVLVQAPKTGLRTLEDALEARS